MLETENFQKFGMFLLLWLLAVSVVTITDGQESLAQRGRPGGGDRGRPDGGGRPGGGDRGRPGGSDRGGSTERRGPSSDQIFGYLDSDKNGRIDTKEIESARGPFKEMLQKAGVDYRRGLDKKSFSTAFEKIRTQRESERSRGDDQSRREEYERRRRDYEKRRAEESQKKSEEAKRTLKKKSPATIRQKDRVTIDIPVKFEEGDKDLDGQIGFYEWKKWKREEISQFAAYDRNGDGFLTPRELEKGPVEMPEASTIAAATPVPASTAPAVTSNSTTPSGSKSSAPSSSSSTSTVDTNSVAARRGESMFRLLDRDRDGKLATTEWDRARTLKPMFEKGGVDLSKPMTKNDFLANYIRLSGS